MKINLVPYRLYCQMVSTVLLNLPFLSPWMKQACVPVLHCYSCPLATMACPIGTIQYFVIIGSFPFIALGTLLLAGVLFGKLFCFYICPFGFLQDLLFRLYKKTIVLPHFLEYGKYVMLVVCVFFLTKLLGHPVFCSVCSAGIIEAGIPIVAHTAVAEPVVKTAIGTFRDPILDMVGMWFWIKVALAAVVLAVAVAIRRPFCRVFCPVGAIFTLCGKTMHTIKTCSGCTKRTRNENETQ